MRGEKELACLNEVQNRIFTINPFNSKAFQDATDEEFSKEHIMYIHGSAHEHYFGMSQDDCTIFENSLRLAKPNPSLNSFPDFVFEHGFIEQFEITSSRRNRKGYVHRNKHAEFERKVNQEEDKFKLELDETPSFGVLKSKSWDFKYPQHSYENLEKSFTKKWKDHIESLSKYDGQCDIGIFLIDYPERVLGHYVDYNVQSGLCYGDLIIRDDYKFYRLSRDKNLLNFVYEYQEQIKYVIFKNKDYIEVIATKTIPELKKLLPWTYCFYPCFVMERYTVFGTSIPNSEIIDGDNDDETGTTD